MIRNFRHRGLQRFFGKGDHRGIPAEFGPCIERLPDRLEAAAKPNDMNLPGCKFHGLKGDRKGAYAVTVSGNWRITFAFDGEDAVDVELEDYHR